MFLAEIQFRNHSYLLPLSFYAHRLVPSENQIFSNAVVLTVRFHAHPSLENIPNRLFKEKINGTFTSRTTVASSAVLTPINMKKKS